MGITLKLYIIGEGWHSFYVESSNLWSVFVSPFVYFFYQYSSRVHVLLDLHLRIFFIFIISRIAF